jgi:hypothetical protein
MGKSGHTPLPRIKQPANPPDSTTRARIRAAVRAVVRGDVELQEGDVSSGGTGKKRTAGKAARARTKSA